MKELTFTIENTIINAPPGIPTAGLNTGGKYALSNILSTGVALLLVFAVIICLLYLIWGGVKWITSQGDKSKVSAARQQIMYAFIGLFIALSAFMIIGIFGSLFGVKLF